MRTTTISGLLESLALNYSRRAESVRLYETAYAYIPKTLPLTELPDEVFTLTAVAYGTDFLGIKGDIITLLGLFGIETPAFESFAPPYMHPGRSASIRCPYQKPVNITRDARSTTRLPDSVAVGYFGELHPQVCANYEIGTRAYLVVVELKPLFALLAGRKPVYKPLPRHPAIQRDLSLRVKNTVSAAAVEAVIRERAGALLARIELFDVYQGSQLEEGFKSLAYKLSFRAPDRTLTDDEVSKQVKRVLDHLSQKLEIVLREK
jgi:phenylalanyl-tRNA synthetase beta chain